VENLPKNLGGWELFGSAKKKENPGEKEKKFPDYTSKKLEEGWQKKSELREVTLGVKRGGFQKEKETQSKRRP